MASARRSTSVSLRPTSKNDTKGVRPQWYHFSKKVPLGSDPFGTILLFHQHLLAVADDDSRCTLNRQTQKVVHQPGLIGPDYRHLSGHIDIVIKNPNAGIHVLVKVNRHADAT